MINKTNKTMAKELKQIDVKTIPNGYALTVCSDNYMYYNEKDLLEGFMYHVGLNENGCIDKETIEEFIAASIAYRSDDGSTAKKMLKTEKENESLRSMCDTLRKRIKALESVCEKTKGKSEMKRLLEDDDDE